MQVIDQIIQEEVAYYKDIYEEQGISGLLEHLKNGRLINKVPNSIKSKERTVESTDFTVFFYKKIRKRY